MTRNEEYQPRTDAAGEAGISMTGCRRWCVPFWRWWLMFTFVIRLIGVDGHSMVPTLQDGDRLLVLNSMLYHDYQYGDIVVPAEGRLHDNDPIVKRVIATEGQTVDIDFDTGSVYVDGEAAAGGLYQRADLHGGGDGISPDGAGGLHLRHGGQPQPQQRQPGLPAGHGGHPVRHRQGGVPAVPGRGLRYGQRDFGRIGS